MKRADLFGRTGIFSLAVIVSALGYFVDIYDIVLFGIVRTPSLKALGVPEDQFFSTGVSLINTQMWGMLIGGVLWGVMGDRAGRLSILFGSILLYSLANLANAFVTSVDQYLVLRFLAGIGLAGELGGAITLVTEIMPKERRGYGATVISSLGFAGGVAAGLIANIFDWRTAYAVGGGLGLVLLVLRVSMFESGMFEALKARKDISRGDLTMLFWPPRRFLTWLCCIVIGIPLYYSIMIFAYFAPELAKALNATGPVSASNALMVIYGALVFGGIASGMASELLKSRKKAFLIFLLINIAGGLAFLLAPPGMPPLYFYAVDAVVGFGVGYCTLFFIIAAEQFGTNLRSTATSTVTNIFRASTIAITSLYAALKADMALSHAALLIGAGCFVFCFPALFYLRETHGTDLDYLEEKNGAALPAAPLA